MCLVMVCLVVVLVAQLCMLRVGEANEAGRNPFLSRQYSCGMGGLSLEELADCGVGIVSHFPWPRASEDPDMEKMRDFVQRAHELDILVLPYVSAEKAWEDFDAVQYPRNSAGSVPYYHAVSPKEHRDWIIIRPDGMLQLRYGEYVEGPEGEMVPKWDVPPGPGSYYMCANVAGYRDAVIKGCRETMELGFDGLFIDNAVTARLMRFGRCYGPDYKKHEHRFPDQDNQYAYTQLMGEMVGTIRSFGDEKIAFLNGGLESAFDDVRDVGMLESYVCGGGQGRWHSWEQVQAWAKAYEQERVNGRVVTALSYIDGQEHPKLDDAYYCYCCALWSGFVWAGSSDGRVLYRAHLIQPRAERTQRDGIYYRLYDNGIVAVNPSDQSRSTALPLIDTMTEPVDLYSGMALPCNGGEFTVNVPPESGRVYIHRAEAVRVYAEEARMLARREQQREEHSQLSDGSGQP